MELQSRAHWDAQDESLPPPKRPLGRAVLKRLLTLVKGDFDPRKAFPTELADEIEKGAAVPVLYSGPLYTSNGAAKAQAALDLAYTKVELKDADVSNAIKALEEQLPESAFAAPRHRATPPRAADVDSVTRD